jgi:hypothetical protein
VIVPLSDKELVIFHDQGLALQTEALSLQDLCVIRTNVSALLKGRSAGRVMERDNQTVRALHGCHLESPLFNRLVRLPILLGPVQQILQSDVYLYQFKINFKAAFRGDVWPFHQDYVFWHNEDGMPKPRAVSVLIFLDEVTEFNGPIYFMPGSQHEACLDTSTTIRDHESDWHHNVSADLKYRIDDERLTAFVRTYGLTSPKGPPGSVLFFHCNIVHGSPSNISPFPRRMIIITYNAIDNMQCYHKPTRPEFLVGRDFRPLKPLRNNLVATDTDE